MFHGNHYRLYSGNGSTMLPFVPLGSLGAAHPLKSLRLGRCHLSIETIETLMTLELPFLTFVLMKHFYVRFSEVKYNTENKKIR